jgi:hypothetical protein
MNIDQRLAEAICFFGSGALADAVPLNVDLGRRALGPGPHHRASISGTTLATRRHQRHGFSREAEGRDLVHVHWSGV